MASPLLATLYSSLSDNNSNSTLPSSTSLTTRESLSGIFGSISLSCWLFLLLPQLLENYRNGSAEAISLAFIGVWFIGDVANLAGALWAGLVPVIVAIAVYFCIADGVLIGQCLYYGIKEKRRLAKMLLGTVDDVQGPSSSGAGAGGDESGVAAADEEEPLLKRTRTNSITIPGSAESASQRARRRSSAASAAARRRRRRTNSSGAGSIGSHSYSTEQDYLAKILEEGDEQTGTKLWFRNAMSVLAIAVVGMLGWAVAYESGAWRPIPVEGGAPGGKEGEEEQMARGAQILGYISAAAYLGARIPQIVKNARDRSCEGLSLLFFILSLMGNLTYGAGILFHSTEHMYVMKNLPWLIGSLGTMVEDVIIFIQFHLYRVRGSDLLVQNESAVV